MNIWLMWLRKFKISELNKWEYPEGCSFEDTDVFEEEEDYKVLRADLVNLFSNTLLLPDLKFRAMKIINDKFEGLKGNLNKFSQNKIEHPMFLLSQMHNILSQNDKDLKDQMNQLLIKQFLSVDFTSINSKIVL